MTRERECKVIEDVAAQVTAWLNAQGTGVSVRHIATTQTACGAHATVWFTPQPAAPDIETKQP
jgi:hypothetical protein